VDPLRQVVRFARKNRSLRPHFRACSAFPVNACDSLLIVATGCERAEQTAIAGLTSVPVLPLFDHTRIVAYVERPRRWQLQR